MKICTQCKTPKEEMEFYTNGINPRRPKCKQCELLKLRKPPINKTCLTCNRAFISARTTQKYCSLGCAPRKSNTRAPKSYEPKPCIVCEVKFTPWRMGIKYCSIKCNSDARNINRRKPDPLPLKKCSVCSKPYRPYTTLSKYCSADCRVENMKLKRPQNLRWKPEQVEKRKGKGNPAYKHGLRVTGKVTDEIGQKAYMKVRDKIKADMLEEHGYMFCERCKINQSYQWEMHHIVYRSEAPQHEHLHNPRNLINLCVKCHNHYHKNKSNRNDLVEERNLQELFGPMYF